MRESAKLEFPQKVRKNNMRPSSVDQADPNDQNLLCVYNITSSSGYINLSITEMTVRGFDWNSGFYDCFLGGAAFRTVLHFYSDEEAKRYAARMFGKEHHTRYLCDNYTSKYNMKGMYDKSMMDVISHTKDGLIFTVYSYKHYSEVNIKAIVGTTPCMGNLNFKPAGENYTYAFLSISIQKRQKTKEITYSDLKCAAKQRVSFQKRPYSGLFLTGNSVRSGRYKM